MKRIGIRAGHTLYGSQGSAGIINECDEARKVKSEVIELLKNYCEIVDLQPDEDMTYPGELEYGVTKANNSNLDLGFSIHFNNAYNTYDGALGTETLIYPNSSVYNVAKAINDNLVNLGFKRRGVILRDGLWELKASHCPWIIVEVNFVEATKDCEIYNNVGVKAIAKAIVEGIVGQELPSKQEVTLPSDFDEQFYLNKYLDVKKAVGNGDFKSGSEHYLMFGAKEGRLYRPEPYKYLVTNYLPTAYSGYSGVDVKAIQDKYFENVRTYCLSNSKGMWIETERIKSDEQLNRIANSLDQAGLFYAVNE